MLQMSALKDSNLNTPSLDPLVGRFLRAIGPLRAHIEAVYLFGSRSRGDFRPDSDYDLLVVVRKRTKDLRDGLYDAVLDILLDTGKLISLKIMKKEEFSQCSSLATPFMQNVMREGIQVG